VSLTERGHFDAGPQYAFHGLSAVAELGRSLIAERARTELRNARAKRSTFNARERTRKPPERNARRSQRVASKRIAVDLGTGAERCIG
jgi:DNA invertase Pin-like site-specific DNA recombinase